MLKKKIEADLKKVAENKFRLECSSKPSLNFYNEYHTAACKAEKIPRKYIRVVLSSRYYLPIFVEKVTQDGTGIWRCKLCKEFVTDKWLHMFSDCNESNQIRNRVDVAETNPHRALFFPSSVTDTVTEF